jgi:hypothetical protein
MPADLEPGSGLDAAPADGAEDSEQKKLDELFKDAK